MAETGSTLETASTREGTPELHIEFCGDLLRVEGEGPFGVGADAELNLDVAASLPARLFEFRAVDGTWGIEQLAAGATVELSVDGGRWRAPLSVGRRLPLVFARQLVHVTGVRGAYELELLLANPLFHAVDGHAVDGHAVDGHGVDGQAGGRRADGHHHGEGCAGHGCSSIPKGMESTGDGVTIVEDEPGLQVELTAEQLVLLAVLAAPVLRHGDEALSQIPSSVEAARALGWPVTKFNRKLDTVCARLTGAGVTGLHGGSGRPALNRRTRLVQVAVAAGLVGRHHLNGLGG